MKKIFALCLAALCLSILASCGNSYSKNEFFSSEILTQGKLADMPLPPNIGRSVLQFGNILYLDITNEEYRQYVQDIVNYLRAKEDIYYLGYSVGSALLTEIMPYDDIAPITDAYDTSESSHSFFFSTVDKLNDRDMLASPIEITIKRETGKLRFEDFEYNTKIMISSGYQASAAWDICGAEHTYDDGCAYKVAGSDKIITEYTCIHCGDTFFSNFIGDMKVYRITIEDTDADQYIIDRPNEYISGLIVEIRTQKLIDADLRFVANGTEIHPLEADDGKWIYKFIMPCADVTITTEIVPTTAP